MISTCPSCVNQINHADDVVEVTCECGHTFQPYLTTSDSHEEAAPSPEGYSESNAAFADIRSFGETLDDASSNSVAPPAAAPKKETTKNTSPSFKVSQEIPKGAAGKSVPLSVGPELPGYFVEEAFGPISLWAEVSASDEDPLGQGIDSLMGRASSLGANGVVGFSWALSPDGSRALLTAVPVRCTKT